MRQFRLLGIILIYAIVGSMLRFHAIAQISDFLDTMRIFKATLLVDSNDTTKEIVNSIKIREMSIPIISHSLNILFFPFRLSIEDQYYIKFGVDRYAIELPHCSESAINDRIKNLDNHLKLLPNYDVSKIPGKYRSHYYIYEDAILRKKGLTLPLSIVYIDGCTNPDIGAGNRNIVGESTASMHINNQ